MKWIADFESSKQITFLRLDEVEVKKLIKILKKPYKESLKKLEKYKDIQEGGEASERQQNILMETEEDVNFMERILNI